MPLNRADFRSFFRRLYGGTGALEPVRLLKRDDDQKMGTVHVHSLFNCRWSVLTHAGEPIQSDMAIGDSRTLHIPRVELDRVGVNYINSLDRFVDKEGRYWEPEAEKAGNIRSKLLQEHIDVDCVRIDPPGNIIGRIVRDPPPC